MRAELVDGRTKTVRLKSRVKLSRTAEVGLSLGVTLVTLHVIGKQLLMSANLKKWGLTESLSALLKLKYVYTSIKVSHAHIGSHRRTVLNPSWSEISQIRKCPAKISSKNCISGSAKRRRRLWRLFYCISSCHHFPLWDDWLSNTDYI